MLAPPLLLKSDKNAPFFAYTEFFSPLQCKNARRLNKQAAGVFPNRRERHYSTVTLLARFRGLSMSHPRISAT